MRIEQQKYERVEYMLFVIRIKLCLIGRDTKLLNTISTTDNKTCTNLYIFRAITAIIITGI